MEDKIKNIENMQIKELELLKEKYGLDATKYFLLKELQYGQDGVFTPEGFVERFNSNLCNDLGNLLNRTVAMCNKYFNGVVPQYNGTPNEVDEEFEKFAGEQIEKIEKKYDEYNVAVATQEIWVLISRTNKYIDETTPWALAKEEQTEKLESVIYHLIENLRKIAIVLLPIMENTGKNILRQLGIENSNLGIWESLSKYNQITNAKV